MASPMKFKTEDEAYKYAAGQNSIKPDKHCPLINRTCLANCQCWQKSYVKPGDAYHVGQPTGKVETWWVYAAQCNNCMFDGGRYEL